MNRFTMFVRYLKNDRTNEYDKILCEARKADYNIISLRDYINRRFNPDKKIMILRHDVDHISNGTRMMFEIEKKYNTTASYYFRNKTINMKLMKDIEVYGSEASLHFETIADFVKARGIKHKSELLASDFNEKCLKILKSNIEQIRLLLDIPCETIASHGEHENRIMEIPNNYLTEDVNSYQLLNIKLEAYNKKFVNEITCYISDTAIEINNGYRYRIHPIDAINKGEKVILFLTHPNHWHYSGVKQVKKLIKSVIKGPVCTTEVFKRI